MMIIDSTGFNTFWNSESGHAGDDSETEKIVRKIIDDVRIDGDAAVRKYASKFDKSSPLKLEVPPEEINSAYNTLRANLPELAEALELSADHINRFSVKQKEQFTNFEYEMEKGLYTGQRVIPVERAAVYIPSGRFPLFSSVLMCMIPALCAGVDEVLLASPPAEDGIPDRMILAAAGVAARITGIKEEKLRVFAVGGAQAIAALALGTESVPRADVIAGPGNRFVAAAKRLLYGQVGIDFIAGPSDVLVIVDENTAKNDSLETADICAADMIAQAEHDPDARARALVPNTEFAKQVAAAVEKRLAVLPTAATASASLENGGLIIVYKNREEAIQLANIIAPEHLELLFEDTGDWIPGLKNYGSLFIGKLSAEALGDYSAGLNHTLPTSGSSRFTGGLSVRHFLKTATTLRCNPGSGYVKAARAAEILARAEGLDGHAQSALARNI